ncbi:FUSC family protein [Segnochrobactrum spirostomi]|uniref:FUSC family protein n=1 Tax=Segnochrobactrum spirostomi TaxID=2608987 RepID=A0A6A7XYS8_9HYPH|nr:FUSC family protein [Segnochrobactrum spirostomi]MQT11623.1 FUSC family protein [Segnochrobactrum spirostomi]
MTLNKALARLVPHWTLNSQVRFSLALRTATACIVPVAIGGFFHLPELSLTGVAAFLCSLADPGGALRLRIASMGLFTGLCALVAVISLSYAPPLPVSMAILGLFGFALSYTMVFGTAASTVGLMLFTELGVLYCMPAIGITSALETAGFILVGGLWAMLLAIVVWRIAPYAPARSALAKVWTKLADLSSQVEAINAMPTPGNAWAKLPTDHWAPLRQAIEDTSLAYSALRRGRSGKSGRGEALIALRGNAEQTFQLFPALTSALELMASRGRPRDKFQPVLRNVSRTLRFLADATNNGMDRRVEALSTSVQRLKAAAQALDAGDPVESRLAVTIGQMVQCLEESCDLTAAVRVPEHLAERFAQPATRLSLADIGRTLRENFTIQSVAFRHAVRAAIGGAAALYLADALHLSHGYWLVITTLMILTPYMATTWRRMLDRILGTMLGALGAAIVLIYVDQPMEIVLLAFVFLVGSELVRGYGYAFYVTWMTMGFLMIADLFYFGGGIGWELAFLRLVDSLIGAALATAIGFLIWPRWEEHTLSFAAAKGVRQGRDFILTAMTRPPQPRAVIAACQRACGLACGNIEASIQRLLNEPRFIPSKAIEPGMSIATAARRISVLSIDLSLVPEACPSAALQPVAAAARAWFDAAFTAIATALEQVEPPPPLPDAISWPSPHTAIPTTSDEMMVATLMRVERQVRTLHDAAARLAEARGGAEGRVAEPAPEQAA